VPHGRRPHIASNLLILRIKKQDEKENNEASKKPSSLEDFVEKTRINKNLTLVVSLKPEGYAIHVNQTNPNH